MLAVFDEGMSKALEAGVGVPVGCLLADVGTCREYNKGEGRETMMQSLIRKVAGHQL